VVTLKESPVPLGTGPYNHKADNGEHYSIQITIITQVSFWLLTHWTILKSLVLNTSLVGRIPVRSSKSTIPKLYTSPFSVTFPVSMYSGHTNQRDNLIQLHILEVDKKIQVLENKEKTRRIGGREVLLSEFSPGGK